MIIFYLFRKLVSLQEIQATAYTGINTMCWHPYQKYNSEKVERVQHQAARFVKSRYSRYSSVSDIGREPKSVSHQVVATLLRQLDFCTLVNRNLFANHYLKVPMFSVAHFFPINEPHFSLALRGGR